MKLSDYIAWFAQVWLLPIVVVGFIAFVWYVAMVHA